MKFPAVGERPTPNVEFMRLFQAIVVLCIACSPAAQANDTPVSFSSPASLSSDTGFAALSWTNATGKPVLLQRASTPEFNDAVSVYKGLNGSYFISGLRDGVYFFRLRSEQGVWSEAVRLDVSHHSAQKAWLLFGLGAIVFLGVVGVILRGAADE